MRRCLLRLAYLLVAVWAIALGLGFVGLPGRAESPAPTEHELRVTTIRHLHLCTDAAWRARVAEDATWQAAIREGCR